mgnify:CR=1 FL=1
MEWVGAPGGSPGLESDIPSSLTREASGPNVEAGFLAPGSSLRLRPSPNPLGFE